MTKSASALWLLGFAYAAIFSIALVENLSTAQATLLTGAVLATTLFVLAIQVYFERKEAKHLSYERLRGDFMTASLTVMQHPQVLNYMYRPADRSLIRDTDERLHRKMAMTFLDTILGLFERAWKNKMSGKISGDEWIQWKYWLYDLTFSEGFDDVFLTSFYDEGFVSEINKLKVLRNSERDGGSRPRFTAETSKSKTAES